MSWQHIIKAYVPSEQLLYIKFKKENHLLIYMKESQSKPRALPSTQLTLLFRLHLSRSCANCAQQQQLPRGAAVRNRSRCRHRKPTLEIRSHEHFYSLQLQHAEFYQVNQNKMKIMHTFLKININRRIK